jgi:deoxyribonuclease-4
MAEKGFDAKRIVVHAPYIINLANSVKPETAQFGIEFLQEELRRTQAIGSNTLVLHPGAHMKAGSDTGLSWIAKGLDAALEHDESDVTIALETMAGKGSELGRSFEELGSFLM